MGYAFVATLIILIVMDFIPGLSLRATPEAEVIGIDEHELGECAYDYALMERDLENVDYHDELLKAARETGAESYASRNESTRVSEPTPDTMQPEMVIVEGFDPATNMNKQRVS